MTNNTCLPLSHRMSSPFTSRTHPASCCCCLRRATQPRSRQRPSTACPLQSCPPASPQVRHNSVSHMIQACYVSQSCHNDKSVPHITLAWHTLQTCHNEKDVARITPTAGAAVPLQVWQLNTSTSLAFLVMSSIAFSRWDASHSLLLAYRTQPAGREEQLCTLLPPSRPQPGGVHHPHHPRRHLQRRSVWRQPLPEGPAQAPGPGAVLPHFRDHGQAQGERQGGRVCGVR